MAPEQTLGRRTDYTPACDIWALGVTLYEVLTGCRPFADDGSAGLYARIRSAEGATDRRTCPRPCRPNWRR